MGEDLPGVRPLPDDDVGRPGDKGADKAGRVGDGVGHRRVDHDGAASPARAGADLDQPVGPPQEVGVVVDDKNRVAVRLQVAHDAEQALDIGRVQPDARLVQDVEDAGGAVAYRPGELDALALPGGQGG